MLVSVGKNTSVVTFSTGSEMQSEMEALSKADRSRISVLKFASKIKSGGCFCGNVAILRVVLKPPCEVRYFNST